jgi:cytoskeleton protein RodZ
MQESGEQPVPLEAVAGEQAPSLGTRLRNAREARELGLEKIADELRIDASVLRALEEDRFADIPVAPVFVKGYIKQYSRQLGLNYGELREAYLAQIGNDQVDLLPSQSIRLRDERQITLWIIAALVLLLVAVFLFVWWTGDDGIGVRRPSAPPAAATVRPAPAPPPPSQADPGADDAAASDAGAEVTASEAPADDKAPRPAAAPTVTEGQIAPPARAAEASPPLAVSRSASVGVVAGSGSATITLRFVDQSWAEVTASDGTRLFYDLGAAGTQFSFGATPPLRVLLGNAPGVEILVDDEPFPIPRQGRRDNVANFVIPAASD